MRTLSSILAALALAGCASAPLEPFPMEARTPQGQDQLELMLSFLEGAWLSGPDSVAPADTTPVVLRLVPIWAGRPGERWLYGEFSSPDGDSRPFRQRVYRIGEGGGKITGIVYDLPGDPARFAGEWRKARPLETLSPADLVERTGCRMQFQKALLSWFEGATMGRECKPGVPGATYDVVTVMFGTDFLKYWERGFDGKGEQVTGSRAGPLNMKKFPALLK
jgi:hypothetical protein